MLLMTMGGNGLLSPQQHVSRASGQVTMLRRVAILVITGAFFPSSILATASPSCLDPSLSTANRSHINLKMARHAGLTHELVSSIAEIVLGEMLGYSLESIYVDAEVPQWGPDISTGIYDMDLETLKVDPLSELYGQYVSKGQQVVDAGALGYSSRRGLYTLRKVVEKEGYADFYRYYRNATAASQLGLRTFGESSLDDFLSSSSSSSSSSRAAACDVQAFSWCGTGELEGYWAPPPCMSSPSSCIEVIKTSPAFDQGYIEQLVKNHQLEAVVGYYGSDVVAVGQHLQSMASQPRTPLFFWWEPSALLLQVDAVRISFPDHRVGCDADNTRNPDTGEVSCDHEEAIVRKMVSRRLREQAPEAFYFISRLELSADSINALLRLTSAAGGPVSTAAEAACEFVKSEVKMDSWVPRCLSNPGYQHQNGQVEIFNRLTESCENRTEFPVMPSTSCFPDGQRPGTVDRSDVKFRIVYRGWSTHTMLETILEALLRDYLGYSVEKVYQPLTGARWGPEIATRLYDIDPESWQVIWGSEVYKEYVETGIVLAGLAGFAGRTGVYIAKELVEKAPMSAYYKFFQNATRAIEAGYPTFNQSLVASYLGDRHPVCLGSNIPWCGAGETVIPGYLVPPQCERDPGNCLEILHPDPTYDLARIEMLIWLLGLEVILSYTSAAEHFNIISKYVDAGQALAYYWWFPDPQYYRVNAERVSFPDYTFGCDSSHDRDLPGSITCDMRPTSVARLASTFLASNREAWYAISRFQITDKDLDEILPLSVFAGGNLSDVELGCEFIRRYEDRITSWVPKCLSDPVPAGQANINDTIFSPLEERCLVVTCPLDQILEYQEIASAYVCRSCASADQVPDATQKACIFCDAGEEVNQDGTACQKCPAGSFALPRSASCSECPKGSFAASSGQSSCEVCPVGMFQQSVGQDACLDCPLGRFAPEEAAEECSPCSPGSAAPQRGLEVCVPCEPGTYQSEAGAEKCNPCSPGSYITSAGRQNCLECLPGYFQPNVSSRFPCERCPVGTFSDSYASIDCLPCSFGTTLQEGAEGASRCQCPPGSFLWEVLGNETLVVVRECLPCNQYMEPCEGGNTPAYQREGFFITSNGQDVYRCASDEACPGGLLGTCPEGSSGRGCAKCEDGEYYWNGDKCEKCAAGEVAFVILFPLVGAVALACIHRFGNDPISRKFSAISELLIVLGLTFNIFLYLNSVSAFDVSWKDPVDILMVLSESLTLEFTQLHFSCSVTMGYVGNYFMTSLAPLGIILVCAALAACRLVNPLMIFNTVATCMYAVYLLFLLHALKPLRYIVHPSGEKSVLDIPTVFQGSEEHTGLIVVGIAVLLIYCVPFAAACVWAAIRIRISRVSRARRWYLVTFRFLFYKFRPEAYYWGICILIRNVAFAIAPSIAPEVPKAGIFMLTIVGVFSAVHTAFVSPWRAYWMNVVDATILCYVLVILNLAAGWIGDNKDLDALLATTTIFAGFMGAVLGSCFMLGLLLSIFCQSSAKREALRQRSLAKEEEYENNMITYLCDDGEVAIADILDAIEKPTAKEQGTCIEEMVPFAWVSRQETSLKSMHIIAKSIRQRKYHLLAFYEDCLQAFPELKLFSAGHEEEEESAAGNARMLMKSMHRIARKGSKAQATGTSNSGPEGKRAGAMAEQQRTIGALFAVYCLCRVDMDGKEIMAFGVDETTGQITTPSAPRQNKDELKGTPWGKMQPEERREHFHSHFNWTLMEQLFLQSGILLRDEDGKGLVADAAPDGRLIAMLSLTAYHDIMKDRALCPTVMGEPYAGVLPGERIDDHDLALAYVLDRHPDVLPSFRVLHEQQRRLVRFTQCEMGFNAGWLVQAEGPPSAVLGKLKQAIEQRGALGCDVAFYFVHWVTDLAGAEPTPFRGSEKFAVKFPPAVLQGLLGCFSVVEMLASSTETEVYEAYISQRWQDQQRELGGPLPAAPSEIRVAKMRLHCMAQQHAQAILKAFDRLPEAPRRILIRELAATGFLDQRFSDWASQPDTGPGTPFLLYYGPAWCQRVGGTEPELALLVMADIFQVAREAYPASLQPESDMQAGITYRTLELSCLKTVDVESFKLVYEEAGKYCIAVHVQSRLEATVVINVIEA